jgi:iron-sulfur cluster repair protein YtfE (RIC family)
MVNDKRPSLELTVREMLERWPATHPVLIAYGLATCCGGVHSVAAAASAHGVDHEMLLAEIRAAAEERPPA